MANVTDMVDMFSGCDELTGVTLGANFSFKGSGSSVLCTLPDRDWIAASSGLHFTAQQIAEDRNYIADTYTASSALIPSDALHLPDSLTVIESDAFAGVKNVAVYIPSGVTGIAAET